MPNTPFDSNHHTDNQPFTEALHADLFPYAEEAGDRGQAVWFLRSPLVYMVPIHDPALANEQYRLKLAALTRAANEADWHTWLFLHQRPYRVDALLQLMDEHQDLPPERFAQLAADVWTDSENIFENLEEWFYVFSVLNEPHVRRAMMAEEDQVTFDALPQRIAIYRGGLRGLNDEGLSWTLDNAIARFFARRSWLAHQHHQPVILRGTVLKDEVIAFFDAAHRREREIVVPDTATVRVQEVEEISFEGHG